MASPAPVVALDYRRSLRHFAKRTEQEQGSGIFDDLM
jgi:hypothetical protein